MKKSGEGRLKYAVNGSTLSTATRSPFPDGEGKEEAASPQKESQPRLAALGSPFQGKGLARTHPPSSERRGNSAFPVSSFRAKARNLFRSQSNRRCEDSGIPDPKPSPRGEGAPKGRIGQERYEKERRRSSQVRRLREYPSAAGAVIPRIVISSESEKSFSFAVKQKMWG